MSIESKAKMATIEEVTKMVEDQGVGGMTLMAVGMQTMMAIELYDKHLNEGVPDVSGLLKAIEEGGFTDESGTNLTATLTYKQLKKKLVKEETEE